MDTIIDRLNEEARLCDSLARRFLISMPPRTELERFGRGWARGYVNAQRSTSRRLRRLALECSDPDPYWRPKFPSFEEIA